VWFRQAQGVFHTGASERAARIWRVRVPSALVCSRAGVAAAGVVLRRKPNIDRKSKRSTLSKRASTRAFALRLRFAYEMNHGNRAIASCPGGRHLGRRDVLRLRDPSSCGRPTARTSPASAVMAGDAVALLHLGLGGGGSDPREQHMDDRFPWRD